MTYILIRDPSTGIVVGVFRSDGATIPNDPANPDWQAFLIWNAAQTPPLSLEPIPPFAKQPRLLYDIYRDLGTPPTGQLTNTQIIEVWDILNAGTPPLWSTTRGGNEAAMVAIHWASTALAGATTAEKNDARKRLISMYCQQNPTFLVNPSFDPSINIPGDELTQ